MNKSDAERVSIALLQAASRLGEAALVVEDQDAEPGWERYRHAIDWAAVAVSIGLCKPLWMRYPELKPDIFGGPFRIDPGAHEIRPVVLKEFARDFGF